MRTPRRSSTWVSKAFPQCANCVHVEFVSDSILVLLHSFMDSRQMRLWQKSFLLRRTCENYPSLYDSEGAKLTFIAWQRQLQGVSCLTAVLL